MAKTRTRRKAASQRAVQGALARASKERRRLNARLDAIDHTLGVNFKRIAQIQAELDELKKLLTKTAGD